MRALYLDEGGVPLVAERCMDVSCQLELPEDCRVSAAAGCSEEVQGSLGDRGIEVRFPVDFRVEAAAKVKRVCITGAKVNTEAPKGNRRGAVSGAAVPWKAGVAPGIWPSGTIPPSRLFWRQTSWKREELPRDQLLLIPRKRA